ncbi:MAG TPA: hypothetical protein VEG27_01185 [Usitatibacter sp.]|nr:hypothetical protein [Usitatibacter sp.]
MQRWGSWLFALLGWLCVGVALPPQDPAAWLESQGLEARDTKTYEEFEAVVARVKGATDAVAAAERVVLFRQGRPVWQTNPKETDPGSRWTIHALGRDLDGSGQPDMHISSFSGGSNCCTTHFVYRLKPQVRRLAAYEAGAMGGGEFMEVPGRKLPVMVSADDSSANAFAPYANSYFPMVILEVGGHGRLQFALDLMQSQLPGQPPPVCSTALGKANLWLQQRCAEYLTSRRQARTAEIKAKLAAIKSNRSGEKLEWDDYFASGVLSAVSAELNRYAYTGHGNAGLLWLETVWPGNDEVKVRLLTTLRQTQAKSAFAEDLKRLALDNR